MTAYDWFILCVAIPCTAFGFVALFFLWCFIIYDIWIDR